MCSFNIAQDQREHFDVIVPFKRAAARWEQNWLIISPTAVNQREEEKICIKTLLRVTKIKKSPPDLSLLHDPNIRGVRPPQILEEGF